MALYDYRYIDPSGRKKRAHVHANTLSDAKEVLRAKGIVFLSLIPRKRGHSFFQGREKKNLLTFTTQLSQLLAAGVPLYESLLALEEQYRDDPFHPTLLTLCEQIKGGTPLSEAMRLFPHIFDTLYCAMVAAGESIGALDQTLDKLSTLLTKQKRLKKQLTTALIYPLLLFSFSLVVISALLFFVIPSLEILFEEREVNGFTKAVMGVSHFLTQKWPLYLPVGAALVGALVYLFRSAKGKHLLQGVWLRTPLVGTLVKQTAMARFCRTMGTLFQGGVTIIQALQISRKVMQNAHLEAVIEKAEKEIVAGSSLSRELKKSPLIPTLVPRMLAIGEEGGSSATMLHKVADFYEEEIDKTLGRVTALAQPVILVVMGGIVGIIMLAVLLPLTDVSAFM